MARLVRMFDAFRGEHGRLGAYSAPPGSYAAVNMLVAANGTLHVRPGLIEATPGSMPTGKVWAFESTPVETKDGFFITGTTPHRFDLGTPATAVTAITGSLASTPTRSIKAVRVGTALYFSSYGDKAYVIDVPNSTLTALTGSPGGHAIEVYGERAVIGDFGTTLGNRLRYSAAGDFNSWPAANFIDVGDEWQITAVNNLRGYLSIAKQGSWWILTGVPGVNDVLRRVAGGDSPYRPHNVATDTNLDKLWFAPLGQDHPAFFDGAGVSRLQFLNYAQAAGLGDTTLDVAPIVGAIGVKGNREDGVLYCTSVENKAALFLNGAWSFFTLGQNISGLVVSGPNELHPGSRVTFCDGGAAGVAAKMWTLDLGAGTPGIEGGTHMRAGDGSSTALSGSVTFPEQWAPAGSEWVVRAVIVDFASFATGSATTNHFDVTVQARRVYESAGAVASATQSYDEAAGASSATGTLRRKTFQVGGQGAGSGFQLEMANVRGVAIHRIICVIDEDRARV